MNRAEVLYKLVGTMITMDIPIITATNQFRRKANYLVVAARGGISAPHTV